MIHRPDDIGAFEFAVLASLRAAQLRLGCVPKIDGDHNVAVIAQLEIASRAVGPAPVGDGAHALAPGAILG